MELEATVMASSPPIDNPKLANTFFDVAMVVVGMDFTLIQFNTVPGNI